MKTKAQCDNNKSTPHQKVDKLSKIKVEIVVMTLERKDHQQNGIESPK